MTLRAQLLQDAPEGTDHGPLMNLLYWIRENGDTGFYLPYDSGETGCCIVDLGHLHQGIQEWQDPDFGGAAAGIPPPPDIREYLEKEMQAGRHLAWVSW